MGKLEKIIHSKEKEISKAVDLLRLLERIKLNKELLATTKVDLTIEAVKHIIKDNDVQRISSRILSYFRKVKNKIEKVSFNLDDEKTTKETNTIDKEKKEHLSNHVTTESTVQTNTKGKESMTNDNYTDSSDSSPREAIP